MMQSTNKKCNILQSIFGVFLHSCNTPQRVIQSLARNHAVTLTHMTSATLTYLEHGVCADDLKCSAALWDKSALNPNNDVGDVPLPRTYFDFIKLKVMKSRTQPYVLHVGFVVIHTKTASRDLWADMLLGGREVDEGGGCTHLAAHERRYVHAAGATFGFLRPTLEMVGS
jgi:hypothetical protein